MDHLTDQLFGGGLAESRIVVDIADDLAAKQPHMVDVVLAGSLGQAGLGKVNEEGQEGFDEPSSRREVFGFAHPPPGPLGQIAAIGQERDGRRGGGR